MVLSWIFLQPFFQVKGSVLGNSMMVLSETSKVDKVRCEYDVVRSLMVECFSCSSSYFV